MNKKIHLQQKQKNQFLTKTKKTDFNYININGSSIEEQEEEINEDDYSNTEISKKAKEERNLETEIDIPKKTITFKLLKTDEEYVLINLGSIKIKDDKIGKYESLKEIFKSFLVIEKVTPEKLNGLAIDSRNKNEKYFMLDRDFITYKNIELLDGCAYPLSNLTKKKKKEEKNEIEKNRKFRKFILDNKKLIEEFLNKKDKKDKKISLDEFIKLLSNWIFFEDKEEDNIRKKKAKEKKAKKLELDIKDYSESKVVLNTLNEYMILGGF
ncbi:hypothetical protein OSSY52_19030 [Tepiditoga spiralis]|uniref:Uncharacterized protein n=1 Tax=Tepiditoga spiralis TaxID=2108365 RepID=A0A7G1GBG4_9BACT|nr:hypothetical protein [Tepiditoga spiralis]BBE31762.1 hypothetical protein OSSY52_19030 [Tepiditoga spiralis]